MAYIIKWDSKANKILRETYHATIEIINRENLRIFL